MSFEEGKFPGHNGVQLHYISNVVVDPDSSPVLIIPALPESAIDYKDIIFLLENRTLSFTHRGRELSDTPKNGYSLQDHGEDIACAIEHFKLDNLVIVTFSRGVAYFFQILPKIKDKVRAVVLIDYPPEYPAHKLDWPAKFLNQNWRAMSNKERFPKPWVLNRIQVESTATDLWHNVPLLKNKKVLLMIGARDYNDPFLISSKVNDSQLKKYKEILPKIEIIEFDRSGHDLRLWEYDRFLQTIKDFLKKLDPQYKHRPVKIGLNKGKGKLFNKFKNFPNRVPGIEKSKLIKLND